MQTLHPVQDEAKVERLAESMERDGWQGAPVVVDGEQALTGVHRIAAWKQVNGGTYGLPTIDIEDVFAEAGLDWQAEVEAEGGDWVYVLGHALPESVREKYGIDIH